MRIRKNLLHKCVNCVTNQNPWNVLSPSELSENLQIIEANDRFFREGAPGNSSPEPRRISPEPARSTEKVVKHPRVPRRKRQEASSNCDDDIYDYYAGFGPNRKKKIGANNQSCREAAGGSNVGRKEDHNDDHDEKPLKERSMKSLLAVAGDN